MFDRRTTLKGIGASAIVVASGGARAETPADTAAYRRIAQEAEDNLRRQVLDKFFPRTIDRTRGGYHQNYAEDWSPIPKGDRAIVYQARLTWTAAQAAALYPAQAKQWVAYSNHGLDYMNDHLWDAERGGFYWGRLSDAPYLPEQDGLKNMYGHAFGIYAAAANYQYTRNPKALALAKKAFAWLDEHAHDDVNLGYRELLDRNGVMLTGSMTVSRTGTGALGQKSMNTHIHILEALTGLYEVWPDPKLRARLEEVFLLVRDRIAKPNGHLEMFFKADWTPAPRALTFGHDVETGFLLVEASTVLGRPNDARTWEVARRLVDQPMVDGWDNQHGGFYDEAELDGKLSRTNKVWWVQAEGLNALLLMHDRYGRENPRYWQYFLQQWAFIQNHQIDSRYGGWLARVAPDGAITPGALKAERWTESYHQARALIRVRDRLRSMAGDTKRHS